MEVRVKLNAMRQSAQDMNQLRKQLNLCQSELEAVKRDLLKISHIDVPLAHIKRCQNSIEMQSRYCSMFENVIYHVSRLYESNENKLIEDSENVRMAASRDNFENRSLRGIASIFYMALQNR